MPVPPVNRAIVHAEAIKSPPIGHVMTAAPTNITAFVGRTASGPTDKPAPIVSFADFERLCGGLHADLPLTYAVRDFYQNGGQQAVVAGLAKSATAADIIGDPVSRTGIYQLDDTAVFNTLCILPDSFTADIDPTVYQAAATYCTQRHAMLLIDPPGAWTVAMKSGDIHSISPAIFGIPGSAAGNVAVFAPRIMVADPLRDNQLTAYAPSGAVAGMWAASDARTGVWKAPAGAASALAAVATPEIALTEAQSSSLAALGINPLRHFPAQGTLVWGARTLASSATGAEAFQYIPVRRFTNFIELSLHQGTQWAVFEPNAEPLWTQIRLSISAFLQSLFVKGAFAGSTPESSYFVRCDATTMTQSDLNNGTLIAEIGVAVLKPAEFVIFEIQQWVEKPPKVGQLPPKA